MDLLNSGSREDKVGCFFFHCSWYAKDAIRISFSSSKKKKSIEKVKFLGAILGGIMQSLCHEEITIGKLEHCLA